MVSLEIQTEKDAQTYVGAVKTILDHEAEQDRFRLVIPLLP